MTITITEMWQQVRNGYVTDGWDDSGASSQVTVAEAAALLDAEAAGEVPAHIVEEFTALLEDINLTSLDDNDCPWSGEYTVQTVAVDEHSIEVGCVVWTAEVVDGVVTGWTVA